MLGGPICIEVSLIVLIGLIKKDKGYRRYASTVERVLAQFDTAVEEWADYISFLGRLLKVAFYGLQFSLIANDVLGIVCKTIRLYRDSS